MIESQSASWIFIIAGPRVAFHVLHVKFVLNTTLIEFIVLDTVCRIEHLNCLMIVLEFAHKFIHCQVLDSLSSAIFVKIIGVLTAKFLAVIFNEEREEYLLEEDGKIMQGHGVAGVIGCEVYDS